MLNRGDIIQLAIDKFIFEGYGLGVLDASGKPEWQKYENIKVLVPFAYPGDVIRASVRKVKKKYIEARLVEVLTPSPFRVEPRCKFFKVCGGCKQQDLAYAQQLRHKEQQVRELLEHTGKFENVLFEPAAGSEREFFYRNKMEFSFSPTEWLTEEQIQSGEVIERRPALGLHVPQGFNKVLNIDGCFLQSELSNRVLRFTSEYFFSRGISVYDNTPHAGYLRNLVIKQSAHYPETMVNLVTFTRDEEKMKDYTGALLAHIPEITTVINSVNTRKAMIAVGETEYADYGPGFIRERIGRFEYRVSANAFFQTNSKQAETLYAIAAEYAAFRGNEIVYDLYCGSGTISLFISDAVKHVYGFEVVEQAVKDAGQNKLHNGVANADFFVADLYASILPVVAANNLPQPDVIILDPPRSGMHKNTIADVLALAPSRIVYVSCNPATQVRDISDITAAGYRVVKTRPVDMFPHTFHIENVALLVRES